VLRKNHYQVRTFRSLLSRITVKISDRYLMTTKE